MFEFRKATPSDAEALSKLVNSGYRGDHAKKGWTTEAHLLDGQRTDVQNILEMQEAPGGHFELAFNSSSELEGCVYLRVEGADTCYLGMLTVDPVRQARGLGKILIGRSEELARAWGCKNMRMRVISVRQELVSFYERRGYRLSGVREPFQGIGSPKVQGLEFVELVKEL